MLQVCQTRRHASNEVVRVPWGAQSAQGVPPKCMRMLEWHARHRGWKYGLVGIGEVPEVWLGACVNKTRPGCSTWMHENEEHEHVGCRHQEAQPSAETPAFSAVSIGSRKHIRRRLGFNHFSRVPKKLNAMQASLRGTESTLEIRLKLA